MEEGSRKECRESGDGGSLLKLDPGRGQYNSSRRMNEADERHTPGQSTYPAASLRLGIAWITHTPRGVHRLHQTLVGLERLMTWGPVLASLCVNARSAPSILVERGVEPEGGAMYCFKVRLGCGVLGRRLARQGWRLGDAEQYTKRQGSLALTQRNKVVRCVVLCVTASPEARPPLMLPPSLGLSALTPSIGPLPGHPSSSSQRHRWGCFCLCWLADRWRPAWAEWSGACACLCALSSVGAHPSARSVCAVCSADTPSLSLSPQ